MSDFLSRSSEITPVDRSATRAPSPVAAIRAAGAKGSDLDNAPRRGFNRDNAPITVDEELAGAAEYAQMQARIADILAELRDRSDGANAAVADADAAIRSLMPVPVVIIPPAPADKTELELAVGLAERITQQRAQAIAAHAVVRPGTVEGMLASAA